METIMRGCTSMPVAMHLPHTAPRRLVTTPRPAAARHVCRPSFSGRTARHIVASAPSTIDKTKTSAPEETEEAINAIRFLAIDAVNKANSGHPGMPMGCAPIGYLVWNEYMTHNPQNPDWFNHDRFILSNGHGSMLQYALMHLSGYKSVSLEDCKNFRQWGSNTPGHPENFVTHGVEVTTGPLGQGFANAVGLAIAEAHLGARFNKPDAPTIVDHHTFVIMGDGCAMEGVTNEAASLAGHLGLHKLIVFYDDNKISIDGHTDLSFSEDVYARYRALGWHTQVVEDGNTDIEGLRSAIENAMKNNEKPHFIGVKTLIGYGSPNKANTHGVHGAPLGSDETGATREQLKWDHGEFEIPPSVYDLFKEGSDKGARKEAEWNKALEEYTQKYPKEGADFKQLISGDLPEGWADALPTFTPEDKGLATRLHSQTMLNALETTLPGFFGGSADLAPSNMTLLKAYGDFAKGQYQEKNIRFGVREHAMASISNGIALHSSGLIPYCATFYIFTDYARPGIRMAALSQAGVLFVTTHDSIGLGEDGPTHQPIEHLASFRAMPNVLMLRPGDGNETAGAYKTAVENARALNVEKKRRPSVLAFSRQGMPNLPGTSKEGVAKGGYIVHGGDGTPDLILLSTGSELNFAVEAATQLEGEGKKVRVVSLVSWELFEDQDQSYRDSILPPDVTARVSIEAGSTFGWSRYVGQKGISIGIDTFGASAPGPLLYEKYGITVENLVATAKKLSP